MVTWPRKCKFVHFCTQGVGILASSEITSDTFTRPLYWCYQICSTIKNGHRMVRWPRKCKFAVISETVGDWATWSRFYLAGFLLVKYNFGFWGHMVSKTYIYSFHRNHLVTIFIPHKQMYSTYYAVVMK